MNQYRRRARAGGKTVTAETLARVSVRLAAPPPAWDLPADPACAGADPGLFFGPERESPEARGQRVTQAGVFCAACRVSRECLDGAVLAASGMASGAAPTSRPSAQCAPHKRPGQVWRT